VNGPGDLVAGGYLHQKAPSGFSGPYIADFQLFVKQQSRDIVPAGLV
jgi:hypothetical protein